MKTIVVYHQVKTGMDCPDGICAAWVVCNAIATYNFELIGDCYLNNEDYELPDYQLPFDPSGKRVILVDFSYPAKIMSAIALKAQSLTVLDHHASRMDDIQCLGDRVLGGYRADECGATFAWKFFHGSEPTPWFLPHVRRRDIGADGYYEGFAPESEAVGLAMSARRAGKVGLEAFPVFEQLLRESEANIIAEGMPAIIERDRLINEELDAWHGEMMEVGDYRVPVYRIKSPECYKHYSMLGNKAAQKHFRHFFVAVICDDPKQISLRSYKGEPDLSEIAKSLGGGGHAKAAGYRLP